MFAVPKNAAQGLEGTSHGCPGGRSRRGAREGAPAKASRGSHAEGIRIRQAAGRRATRGRRDGWKRGHALGQQGLAPARIAIRRSCALGRQARAKRPAMRTAMPRAPADRDGSPRRPRLGLPGLGAKRGSPAQGDPPSARLACGRSGSRRVWPASGRRLAREAEMPRDGSAGILASHVRVCVGLELVHVAASRARSMHAIIRGTTRGTGRDAGKTGRPRAGIEVEARAALPVAGRRGHVSGQSGGDGRHGGRVTSPERHKRRLRAAAVRLPVGRLGSALIFKRNRCGACGALQRPAPAAARLARAPSDATGRPVSRRGASRVE